MNLKFVQNTVGAGFFSDFNVIVGCLDFIIRNKITNFTFVWNNVLYQNTNENLFSKFFFPTPIYDNYESVIDALSIGATYYQPVNEREKFINSFNVLSYFNYFQNPSYVALKEKCVKAENSIGVHVRGTDHWKHDPLVNLDVYFKTVDEKLKTEKYSKIFLATDESRYVDAFRSRYGDMVTINDNITRSNNSSAIHCSGFTDKEKLITDVMIDAISLASCDDLIITSSNVSAYSLSINPYVKYTFVDLLH